MTKNEIFQFVNKLNNLDIPTMIYRETVFDIISFGKSNKIHLAATASIERIKRTLPEYDLEMVSEEKDTLKCVIDNDTFFIHSIFKMSYDDFVRKMVATDLTFNSLLMKPNGQIYDMYGGLDDLKNKRLSFVKSFNEEPRNHLTLNCIRYIYKNNFTYDEKVKKYIENSLRSFSRSEKTNALFYLVEFINKTQDDDDRISLILNDDFFKNDKQPNICIGDYKTLINEIGKEKFIFLLLLLLHVNVNKSRFSSIIDNEEFHEIKDAFNLNLTDEITYYDLKERKGYDFLSSIIILQREYAKMTCSEYTESEFHKKSVFDVIEQSNTASTINDDFILPDDTTTEKIKLPQKDAFDFSEMTSTDVSTMDFSSLFEETEENIVDIASDTFVEEPTENIIETTSEEIITPNVEIEEESKSENKIFEDTLIPASPLCNDGDLSLSDKTKESVVKETDETLDFLESVEENIDETAQLNGAIEFSPTTESFFSENSTAEEPVIENTKSSFSLLDDELSSLLNEDDDRENKPAKKRSTNPNLNKKVENCQSEEKNENSDVVIENAVENNVAENVVKNVVENITEVSVCDEPVENIDVDISLQSFEQTTNNNEPVQCETNSGEINIDELFATSETNAQDERIQVERFERKPQTKAENLIDSIYDEEVKLPEISLSPELDNLVSQVADETKNDTVNGQRKIVTEVLMSDVISDAELISQSNVNPEQQVSVTTPTSPYVPEAVPENFEINEQDLEEILAELNGKKKNSFLDDDSVSEDNDVISENIGSYAPSTPSQTYYTPTPAKPSSSEDEGDFFKSLNDDFAEIVGGNN